MSSFKKWPVKGLCGRCLSVWGPLPSYDPIPTPLHIVYVYTVYLFPQGGKGESWTREKVRGAIVYNAGSKIPTWLTESPVFKLWYTPAAKVPLHVNFLDDDILPWYLNSQSTIESRSSLVQCSLWKIKKNWLLHIM
jgi:hypothetical protein